VFLDQRGEFGAGEMLQQLIEQARDLYHCLALLLACVWRRSGQGTIRQRLIIGGLFFWLSESQSCLGQE
jgi:hypothetical protein